MGTEAAGAAAARRPRKSRFRDVNMLEGPIFGKMVLYTLPLMFSGILQIFYNAADVAVVGRFAEDGDAALAAVGSTGALTNLIVGLFTGLSVGSCVVISYFLGAADNKNVSETVHTSVATGFIFGLVLAGVGIVFADDLLKLMKNPDDARYLAALYMRIYFAGMPASMLYNFGSSVLRAKGDTSFPLTVLIISGAVNVALNLVTVIGFRMGVAGVASATIASQIVSAAMVLIHLGRLPESDPCRFSVKLLRIKPDKLWRITKVGIPAGIQGVVFSISNVMLQSAVNSLGTVAMAGNTAASNVDGFVYISCNSVYHAAVAFTGQNYGAHKLGRIKKVAGSAVLLVCIIGLTLGATAFFLAEPLLEIYAPGVDKAAIREYGLLRLHITALTYFMCGLMEVSTGLLRGLGSSVLPMIISIFGSCVLRIAWIELLFYRIEFFHNMFWLYMSYPISWMLTTSVEMLVFLIVYRKIMKGERGKLKHTS